MNIETDLIRSKQFNSPIKPYLLKFSQEYRVLATLRYLFPQKYATMTKGEVPDLQDSENGIGIEVVSAVRENDMRAERAFSRLRQSSNDSEAKKQIDIIESSGCSLGVLPNGGLTLGVAGTANTEKLFFQTSIRKKKEKISKYRENFNVLGLSIVLPEIPTPEAECKFIDWTREVFREDNNRFNFVYMISHRFCIYYDIQADYFQKWELSEKDTCLLRTIARMTAEGELSLDSQEWQ